MRTTTRAAGLVVAVAIVVLGPAAGAAFACGGLIAPNGTISLTRTTTLAAYHNGIEHYLTSFQYAGSTSGDVGSIVPLPGVPTDVIKGGDWTLQRLELEAHPPQRGIFAAEGAAALAPSAQIILKTTVDSLDITVLKGGALAVGNWARDHGFFLPPDAPQVLDFYAQRSPIFMAVKFSAERAAAQGITQGEGTPVDVVIPTPSPWVPLRILTLGQKPDALVQADVFLLTDREPATLPQAVSPSGRPNQQGLIQRISEPASSSLLDDLRRDKRMGWVPQSMWLSYIDVNERAGLLKNDLAIDASGFGQPDPVAAGYVSPELPLVSWGLWTGLSIAILASMVLVTGVELQRRLRRPVV
jgi:hypothetical protein